MAKAPRARLVSIALAAEIRVAAARLNMKTVDIADQTGIPRSTMAKIWNGETAIDVDQLMLIAGVLNAQPGDMLAVAKHSAELSEEAAEIIGAADLTDKQKQQLRNEYVHGRIAREKPGVTPDLGNHSTG